LGQRHGFEHGFPLIRSLRASAPRSTSVLFSFVVSLLIVAGQAAEHQYDCGNDKLGAMFFNDRIKLAQF